MNAPGRFITFEGIEGSGKSTQIQRVQRHLEAQGRRVCVTREPGGTPMAEAIRDLLLDPAHAALSPAAELFLYEAARAQHVDEKIRPALEAGQIVLCDRFADSTTAYQGAGRGLERNDVLRLHQAATRGVWPDLTIVLDLPAEAGLARARQTGAPDRIEAEPLAFHERVRHEFLRLANEEPNRIAVYDAAQPADALTAAVCRRVDQALEAS